MITTNEKIEWNYNQNALSEYNQPLIEQNPQLINQIIDLLNKDLIADSKDYLGTFNSVSQIKKKLEELTSNSYEIKYKDLILAFIVRNDKSESIKEIAFIEYLRYNLNNDLNIIRLDKNEIEILKEKIIKSDMKSLFKGQLISDLDKHLSKLLNL